MRLERKITLADEGRNVQQMDPKAQKLISNYAKNFKDRYRAEKKAEAMQTLGCAGVAKCRPLI